MFKILITYLFLYLTLVGQSADFIVIQFEFYPGLGRPCTVDLIKIATVFISITNPITKASLVDWTWVSWVTSLRNLYNDQIWHIADLELLRHVTAIWAFIYTNPWKVYYWNELVSSKLRLFALYLCQFSFWPDKTANVRFLYFVLDRCTVY